MNVVERFDDAATREFAWLMELDIEARVVGLPNAIQSAAFTDIGPGLYWLIVRHHASNKFRSIIFTASSVGEAMKEFQVYADANRYSRESLRFEFPQNTHAN